MSSQSLLLSIFFLQDINSVVQSFLPGKLGKEWNNPDEAAKAGHLHLVQALEKKGIMCTSQGIDWAVEFQREDIFNYLCDKGISTTDIAMQEVALNGNINILRKMLQMNTPFKNRHADLAASNGHIQAVALFYQYRIKCSYNGANYAAGKGYINMLKFLKEQYNVKCNEYGLCIAAKCNRPDILEYLFDEQGLIGSSRVTDAAIRLNCIEASNVLIKRGIYGTLEGWTHPIPRRLYSISA